MDDFVLKTCTKCKREKLLECFSIQNTAKDGLKYICKDCDQKLARANYKKNKEKVIQRVINYRKQKRQEKNK